MRFSRSSFRHKVISQIFFPFGEKASYTGTEHTLENYRRLESDRAMLDYNGCSRMPDMLSLESNLHRNCYRYHLFRLTDCESPMKLRK